MNDRGVVIADSRVPGQNVNVAHSVFTQKYRATGDPYPRILEVPVFGHSNNHVGLQLADVVGSALLAPTRLLFFLAPRGKPSATHPGYAELVRQRAGLVAGLRTPTGEQPPRSILVSNPVTTTGHMHLFDRAPSPDQPSPGEAR
jgi:hypothetical protein